MSESPIDLLTQRNMELSRISGVGKDWPRFIEWQNRTRPLIAKFFPRELRRFDQIGRPRKRKRLGLDGIFRYSITDDSAQGAKDNWVALIDAVIELEKLERVTNVPARAKQTSAAVDLKDIFIVHGKDSEMKQHVARVLHKLGLNPVLLHEQPNTSRTIIEKLEHHSDVGFAVVLLSGDDRGYLSTDLPAAAKPRARQNVVLELGYFIGKLGRARICVLKRGEVEDPGELAGTLYLSFDDARRWEVDLVTELQAAGYPVDANNLTRSKDP